MDPKDFYISKLLKQRAKYWSEDRGALLNGGSLWHAVGYLGTKSAKAAGLGDIERAFVTKSMEVNWRQFESMCQTKDTCQGCGKEYKSEILFICVECNWERCNACLTDAQVNEYGDRTCSCGGVMV